MTTSLLHFGSLIKNSAFIEIYTLIFYQLKKHIPYFRMAGVMNINILQRRTQSDEQRNRKSQYDDDQIHARVFRSLKMGHRLPLFVKFRPSPAPVVAR